MPHLPHHHNNEHDLEEILKQSEKSEDFAKISDILGKMGDPKRAQIFWILCHCEECVTDLAEITGMSSPAVSHHLKILKDCELISARREGREVCYQAADSALAKLLHTVTEEIMAVSCPDTEIHPEGAPCSCGHNHVHSSTADSSDLSDKEYESLAHSVHEYLSDNLSTHITIDSLAKHFCVNPTTLKTVFKDVYGNSIAAHTKEHRMEKAASLLKTTSLSVAEIAKEVGFQTQSKFTQAFKEYYHTLPKDYRNCAR